MQRSACAAPCAPDRCPDSRDPRAGARVPRCGRDRGTWRRQDDPRPACARRDGPVIVLPPQALAARSLASRIASEQGWTIGGAVGWHVRFERQFGPKTSVLFATEGILTARLQQDPLLGDFRTVILDEFHERIHSSRISGRAREAGLARPQRSSSGHHVGDARRRGRCRRLFRGGPIVDVPGSSHPLEIRYAPGVPIAQAVQASLRERAGQVLCFLPGAGEIARARTGSMRLDVEVVQLHGSLDSAAQDAAIASTPRRRIVLATNIAETSLTVPGITAVIDSGLPESGALRSGPRVSIASRPSAFPRMRPISGRVVPAGSDRAWRSGCDTRPIASAPIASRRSSA